MFLVFLNSSAFNTVFMFPVSCFKFFEFPAFNMRSVSCFRKSKYSSNIVSCFMFFEFPAIGFELWECFLYIISVGVSSADGGRVRVARFLGTWGNQHHLFRSADSISRSACMHACMLTQWNLPELFDRALAAANVERRLLSNLPVERRDTSCDSCTCSSSSSSSSRILAMNLAICRHAWMIIIAFIHGRIVAIVFSYAF